MLLFWNWMTRAVKSDKPSPSNSRRRSSRVRPTWRPRLEALEGRCLPCTVSNGLIAFQRGAHEVAGEIYVMNADGSGQTNLTNHPAHDATPAWSPDGTKIAFESNRDGNFEIYVMNADGTNATRLTSNTATDFWPAWSPDGTKIAFQSERGGNNDIYVMNADGSGETRLTFDASADVAPAWSPDGTKIAFYSQRDGNSEIYVMNADGSGQTRLTNNTAQDANPAWSPDGTKIAFQSERDGQPDIYVMNADGSGQANVTNHAANDAQPGWSPDGTKILFRSQRDGFGEAASEIYVMNADGTNQTRLTFNTAFDGEPDWQPVVAAINVQIDVKPGSDSNPINLNSNGVLPVAILTTSDFNALDVDAATVKLGDPNLTGQAAPVRSVQEDVDGDGDLDLLLFFKVSDLVTAGALDENSTEVVLTAALFDDACISGTDSVRIE